MEEWERDSRKELWKGRDPFCGIGTTKLMSTFGSDSEFPDRAVPRTGTPVPFGMNLMGLWCLLGSNFLGKILLNWPPGRVIGFSRRYTVI